MSKNKRKDTFLKKFSTVSIENANNNLASRCKFNFSYFTYGDNAGQNFDEWPCDKLQKFLTKLRHFSVETLEHWKVTRIGSGKKKRPVLVVYDSYPTNSDFTQPAHIPHQAKWARFRLEQGCRLIGFIIPDEYNHTNQNNTPYKFCTNTFYIVFLDENHRFYITKK